MVSKGEVEISGLIRNSPSLDAKQTLQLAQQLKARGISSVSAIDSLENEAKAISFKIDSKNIDFPNHTSITFISENMFTEEDLTSDCSALMNTTLKSSQLIGPKSIKESRRGQKKSQNHIFKLFPNSNPAQNKKIVYERKLRKIDHREIKSTAVRQPLAQSNTRRYRSRSKVPQIETVSKTEILNFDQYISLINGKSGVLVQENENSDPLVTFEHNVSSPLADVLEAGSSTTIFDPDTLVSVEMVNPQSSSVKDVTSSENVNSKKEDYSEHPGQLCRLCANSGDAMVYIFGEAGVQLGLRKKINSWLPTHVSKTDPLPKQVCSRCIQKLMECHDFALSCAEAEKKLNNLVKRKKFSCHTEGIVEAHVDGISLEEEEQKTDLSEKFFYSLQDLDNSNCSVKNEYSDTKLQDSFTNDEENEILCSENSSEVEVLDTVMEDGASNLNKYGCPLCCEGNMHTVQKKCADISQPTEALSNKLGTENGTDEQSCNSTTNYMCMKEEAQESTFEDLDSSSAVNKDCNSISEADSLGKETLDSDEFRIEYEIPEKKVRVVFENNEPVTQDAGPVACWVCGEVMESLFDCMAHGLQTHGDTEEGIYPCSQCEESFCTSADMSHHFSSSHFPTLESKQLYSCILCKLLFTTKRNLKSHVCTPADVPSNRLSCSTCGQTFITRARLLFHQKFHVPGSTLKCKICEISFTEEDYFYDHVRFRHKEKMFECNQCTKVFNSQGALRGHSLTHFGERHHKCQVCGKAFKDKQTLKEHEVSHMKIKPFQCHICGKYLNRNSRLRKHLRSHELEKAVEPQQCYQCEVCNETFPTEQLALVHAESGHSLGTGMVECAFQLATLDKVYRCEYCEKCFALPGALNAHRTCHANDPLPFKCHLCAAAFSTFARVATHKVTHGVYDKKDEFTIPKMFLCDTCDKSYVHWTYLSVHWKMRHAEVKYMYKCKQCPEQFVNSWSLAYHKRTRHSDRPIPRRDGSVIERKPFKCETCPKRYTSQQALDTHVQLIHDKNNPGPTFQCDECGKCFARKFSLDSHKKVHSNEKPHVCHICKKTFVHSSGLSTHMRLHRGDKPHACNYCGKTFLQRGDRDDHVRKHTGEKPYMCEDCPKSFRTRAMWFEHSRIHRDERPFPCDICGASFRRSYALKNHKTIHSGQRPFTCEVCGKGFRQKHAMQKHFRCAHGIDNKDMPEPLVLDEDIQMDSHSSLDYIKEEV